MGSHCRPAGHIDGLLHMLGTMYPWCVAAFRNGLSNIPTPIDEVVDRRVVQTHYASRTASRDEIRAPVAPAVSPRTIGNRLLAAGLRSRVILFRLPLIPRHNQVRLHCCHERVDCRKEWRPVVFSDESMFYLYASDGRTCVRRRPGERHRSEFIRPRHRPHLRLHGVRGASVTTRAQIGCFCKVN